MAAASPSDAFAGLVGLSSPATLRPTVPVSATDVPADFSPYPLPGAPIRSLSPPRAGVSVPVSDVTAPLAHFILSTNSGIEDLVCIELLTLAQQRGWRVSPQAIRICPVFAGMRGFVAVTLAEWPSVVYRRARAAVTAGELHAATTGLAETAAAATTGAAATVASAGVCDVPSGVDAAEDAFVRLPASALRGRPLPTSRSPSEDSLLRLGDTEKIPDFFVSPEIASPDSSAPGTSTSHCPPVAGTSATSHSSSSSSSSDSAGLQLEGGPWAPVAGGVLESTPESLLFAAGHLSASDVPAGVLLQFAQDVLLQLRTIHHVSLYHTHMPLPMPLEADTEAETAGVGAGQDRAGAKAARDRTERRVAKLQCAEIARLLLTEGCGVPVLRYLSETTRSYHADVSSAVDSAIPRASEVATAALPALSRLRFIAPPAPVAPKGAQEQAVRAHVRAELLRLRAKQAVRETGAGAAKAVDLPSDNDDDGDDGEHEEDEDDDQDPVPAPTPAPAPAQGSDSAQDGRRWGTFKVSAHRQGHHSRALTSSLIAMEVGGFLQDAYGLSCHMTRPDVHVRLDLCGPTVLVGTQLGRIEALSRRHKKSFINVVTLKTNLACAMMLLAFPSPLQAPLAATDPHCRAARAAALAGAGAGAGTGAALIARSRADPPPEGAEAAAAAAWLSEPSEAAALGARGRDWGVYEPCLHCGTVGKCHGYGWPGMWQGMLPHGASSVPTATESGSGIKDAAGACGGALSAYPHADLPTAAFRPGPNAPYPAWTGTATRTVTILDPFCGGGTVLTEAAFMLGASPVFPAADHAPVAVSAVQDPAPTPALKTVFAEEEAHVATLLAAATEADNADDAAASAATDAPAGHGKSIRALLKTLDPSQPGDDAALISSAASFPGVHVGQGVVVRLLGTDANNRAVRGARANAAAEGMGGAIKHYHLDARALGSSLPPESVDAIVTNAPWGQHTAASLDQERLYGQFLAGAWRVLKPGARMVLLVLRSLLTLEVVRQHGGFRIVHVRAVQTTNNIPAIFVLEKAPADPVKASLLAQLGALRGQVDLDRAVFGSIVAGSHDTPAPAKKEGKKKQRQ